MVNAGDVPFLAAAITIAILVTAITFGVLRKLTASYMALRLTSALAFPALLIAIIVYVEAWNPDPHGFVMVGLGFLAFVSLPFTIVTTALLARRFA